jgi:hypothetical protein
MDGLAAVNCERIHMDLSEHTDPKVRRRAPERNSPGSEHKQSTKRHLGQAGNGRAAKHDQCARNGIADTGKSRHTDSAPSHPPTSAPNGNSAPEATSVTNRQTPIPNPTTIAGARMAALCAGQHDAAALLGDKSPTDNPKPVLGNKPTDNAEKSTAVAETLQPSSDLTSEIFCFAAESIGVPRQFFVEYVKRLLKEYGVQGPGQIMLVQGLAMANVSVLAQFAQLAKTDPKFVPEHFAVAMKGHAEVRRTILTLEQLQRNSHRARENAPRATFLPPLSEAL